MRVPPTIDPAKSFELLGRGCHQSLEGVEHSCVKENSNPVYLKTKNRSLGVLLRRLLELEVPLVTQVGKAGGCSTITR